MAFCPNCGTQVEEGAASCPNCGTVFGAAQQNYAYDIKDHTAEYSPADISDNKVFAMSANLLGIVGVIITLLAAQKSPYAMFHARQSMKISICEVLSALLLIVPILGWIACPICLLILFVVRVILFFQVCKGEAKEAPIIGNLGFLK